MNLSRLVGKIVTLWMGETRTITGVLLSASAHDVEVKCNDENGEVTTVWKVRKTAIIAVGVNQP